MTEIEIKFTNKDFAYLSEETDKRTVLLNQDDKYVIMSRDKLNSLYRLINRYSQLNALQLPEDTLVQIETLEYENARLEKENEELFRQYSDLYYKENQNEDSTAKL